MKKYRIVLILCLLFETVIANGFSGGKIYELNPTARKLLFKMYADLKTSANGQTIFSSRYVDTNEKEILLERATYDHITLHNYVITQKQLNEEYELNIDKNKMNFSVTKNGKTEKQTKDLPNNLVIGPSLVPFLQTHWDEIQKGSSVNVEFAVLDRMSTYGFEFQKIRDDKLAGQTVTLVQMKPRSFLVAVFVAPSILVVSKDGSKILNLKGRMLPKKKKGSTWKDFDGEADFEY